MIHTHQVLFLFPDKSGCPPKNSVELVRHIMDTCPGLEFSGIMTIGALARSVQHTPGGKNEDFEVDTRTLPTSGHSVSETSSEFYH